MSLLAALHAQGLRTLLPLSVEGREPSSTLFVGGALGESFGDPAKDLFYNGFVGGPQLCEITEIGAHFAHREVCGTRTAETDMC